MRLPVLLLAPIGRSRSKEGAGSNWLFLKQSSQSDVGVQTGVILGSTIFLCLPMVIGDGFSIGLALVLPATTGRMAT